MLIKLFKSKVVLLFILGWTVFFGLFWSRAITFSPEGAVMAGHVNIWGDWAMHATLTSHMAYQSLLPVVNPLLWGTKLNYPFLADLISAGLVRLGVPFWSALTIPSFIMSVVTVISLVVFYYTVFRSKKVSLVATSIFLFNGGFGFLYYLRDIIQSSQPWTTVFNPPHLATNLESEFIRWISVIDSMIIPQRAFVLGFPLALFGLALVYHYYLRWERKQPPLMITVTIALLFGVLPLAHTHALLASAIIVGGWTVGSVLEKLIHRRKAIVILQTTSRWAILAASVGLIAVPLIVNFFDFSQLSQHFMKWFPGWYSYEFKQVNWVWFWLMNWGLTPILAMLGWATLLRQSSRVKRVAVVTTFAPFLLIFILLNLFLFQPFIWDNTKLLVWVSVGWSGLAAYWLVEQWHRSSQRRYRHQLLLQTTLCLVILLTTFSGLIDTYRLLRLKLNQFQMYGVEELQLAEWVKQNTPAKSVWLSGDVHNHWLSNLTGRQSLLSYRGWMWTHGYRYQPVELDLATMLKNPSQRLDLLDQYQVQYAVIGQNERQVWQADPANFSALFDTVYQTEHYLILKRK